MTIHSIILPTRPQPDTIAAIFLLRFFGKDAFPGIDTARIEIRHTLNPHETFDTLLSQGMLTLDVGGGPFDHHGSEHCTTELVARYFKIERDPALARLLQYVKRDEKEGKGTLSRDPVDRAFGLSGLIASLNKIHTKEPHRTVDAVLPLLEAQYLSAREHHVEMPKEVERKKSSGSYREAIANVGGKQVRVIYIISDKPSMPAYLRSQQGPRADVVVQKMEGTNHISILSRQDRGIDLSSIAALIRLREAQFKGIELPNDNTYLGQPGRITEVPHWYYDIATNSVLNGSPHNTTVEASSIPWNEMQKIVVAGLELGRA